jgi:hypothetical protein
MLILTLLVLGAAWYAVAALGRAVPTRAERDMKTGAALRQAKRALLAYVAQYAARGNTIEPGQMPCPESLNAVGTGKQGQASSNCGNGLAIGRLPWETLGVDEIRDGDGEPVWYVLSPGFRSAPINFGTPGRLTYDGSPNSAVALLIAPGPALNTQSDPAAPPAGCRKVDQQIGTRNTAALDPGNFLECGNETGDNASTGPSKWTNDTVIAITAGDWSRAIAAAVADRLQRQVAPALEQWRSTESVADWGVSFLPYASSFSDPANNDLCGNYGSVEGISPFARSAGSGCTSWSGATMTKTGGSGDWFPLYCYPVTGAMTCSFLYWGGSLQLRVDATAPHAAGSFRSPITAADIASSGAPAAGTSYASSLSPATGAATVSATIDYADSPLAFVTVTINKLPDAAILSDSRLGWFLQNEWSRHAYYAISPAVSVNPGASICAAPGDPGCLTLDGLPPSNGSANDKRLVLALTGPGPVAAQTQPSNNAENYLESHAPGTSIYTAATVSASFNDRLAACPFRQTPQSGGPIAICN